MIKKIKDYFAYRKEMKVVKYTMCVNYVDFLQAQIDAYKAQEGAFKSMQIFGESFTEDDMAKVFESITKIANNSDLKTDYYKQLHDESVKEKSNE